MQNALRLIFFLLVRAFVLVFLGMQVRRRNLLPATGPAIVVANHNSHLDTLVLISLFPLHLLPRVRPVAAADYFLKNRFLAWFSTKVIGIIPMIRGHASKHFDPLAPCHEALARGDILVLFPEGTRGEPEKLEHFKKGIAYLAEKWPQVPITPVFLHGLGKALPRGEFLLVPFFCDVFVGEALTFHDDKNIFLDDINSRFKTLADEGHFPAW